MKQRCLVLDKVGNRLLVSAKDFEFRWVPEGAAAMVGSEVPQPGEVVWLDLQALAEPSRVRRPVALALRALAVAAAVVLIVAVTWTQVGEAWYTRVARGYLGHDRVVVAMDINPSLELYVDEDGVVRAGLGLNDDGRQVLRGLRYGGPVEDFFEQLMTRFEEQHYLNSEPAALMVSCVRAQEQVQSRVELALRQSLQHRRVNVMLVLQGLEQAQWEEARRAGESLNGLVLTQQARQRGVELDEAAPLAEQLGTLGISGQRHGLLAPETGEQPGPGPNGPGADDESPGPGGKQQGQPTGEKPEQGTSGESGSGGSGGTGSGEPGTSPGQGGQGNPGGQGPH